MSEENNSFDDNMKSEFAAGMALLLQIQLTITPVRSFEVTKIEIIKSKINHKAIGYIYGFIDNALQHRSLDITDTSVGLPILYHVFRKLFSGHEVRYVEFLMNHMDDELTVLGMMAGGQEYHEFISDERKKGLFGLSQLIVENQEKK